MPDFITDPRPAPFPVGARVVYQGPACWTVHDGVRYVMTPGVQGTVVSIMPGWPGGTYLGHDDEGEPMIAGGAHHASIVQPDTWPHRHRVDAESDQYRLATPQEAAAPVA